MISILSAAILTILSIFGWLLAAYIGIILILSSLPCFGRGQKKPIPESPFDNTEYYGDQAEGSDRISLLESPVEGLGLRLDLFDRAQHSLDVVCHTIHTGGSTSAFFAGILRAAERGVKVRILLDGKASSIRPSIGILIRALATHPNITCKQYNPLRLTRPWKWHFLMHDKYILSDGQYLLLGGRNIGDKFFAPDDYAGKISNDRDVIVHKASAAGRSESAVDQAQQYFDMIWQERDVHPLRPGLKAMRNSSRSLHTLHQQAAVFAQAHPEYFHHSLDACLARAIPTKKITLLYNPTHAGRKAPWIWEQLQRIAMQAQSSVLLQSPYITANDGIIAAFADISGRVDLSILTNSVASTPNFPAYSNYYARRRRFIQTGARIYEYQNANSIHGKAMVIDGRLGILGSFNMDDRSMYLDTEIMLVVDSEDFAGMLQGAIASYQEESLCLNASNGYTIPDGVTPAAVPVYKVPLLRIASVFSLTLRSLI